MESIQLTMANKNSDNDQLREMAPTLFEIHKQDGFPVPKNYFESLPVIIAEKCADPQREAFMVPAYRLVMPVVLALFVLVSGILIFRPEGQMVQIAEPSGIAEEILYEIFSEERIFDVDEALLVESLASEQASEVPSPDDAAIMDYLIENDIEEHTIINEM